ncbi:response regulator transcription factor [Leuconostoc suionicum]|uniref:response regulator transcription factor n=1 Tax=Leuconostoc suionicum TaxID=1511761 RepID=UPI003A9044B9
MNKQTINLIYQRRYTNNKTNTHKGLNILVKILVIEDNLALNQLYTTYLKGADYHTFPANNAQQALDILENYEIDLILTDILMPEMSGLDFIKLLREAKLSTPIIAITALGEFTDLERGYELGVDDYMVKPINLNELLLRVKALLRRAKINESKILKIAGATFNQSSYNVEYQNKTILLPKKEFDLIYKLISYPNKIFTRRQLLDAIWGLDSDSDARTIDVHINRLREHLKEIKQLQIITVRGLGYQVTLCTKS